MKAVVGHMFEHTFSFDERDVEAFAKITGDNNPLHLDKTFAAHTVFKKPIIHGFLSGSVFSKVFGTIFPGPGSIYVSQEMNFRRPMYPSEPYQAKFEITEVDPVKYTVKIRCAVFNKNGKLCLDGVAVLICHSLQF